MRLTGKLVLTLFALVIAVLAGTVLPLHLAEQKRLVEQIESRQLADLQQFARVCAESMRDGDAASRLGYLKTFILYGEPGTVSYAMFTDDKGSILLHSDFLHGDTTRKGELASGLAVGRALAEPQGLRQLVPEEKGAIDLVSAPVYALGGGGERRAGTAIIAFNHAAFEAKQAELEREALRRILRYGWHGLALGLVLALLLSAALMRPISALESAARLVGAGKLETRIPEDRKDELGDLAREFNAMAKKLAELEELKESFLSQITHDLRSPLSAVMACVDTLGFLGPVNPKQEESIAIASSNAEYLNTLIGNILDITRMEAGRMEFKQGAVDLSALAKAVVMLVKPKADEYKVTVESRVPDFTMVWADEQALKRVLVNLVGNALKFTPSGGTVSVGYALNGRDHSISVSDTGIGVPKEKLGTLFQKFCQIDETKNKVREVRGTGLGLVICKQIVEAHGGSIGVESVYKQGTTFRFTLPGYTAAASAPLAETA